MALEPLPVARFIKLGELLIHCRNPQNMSVKQFNDGFERFCDLADELELRATKVAGSFELNLNDGR